MYSLNINTAKKQKKETKKKVLKMAQIEYNKHLYKSEEKFFKEIVKEIDINFRTVQKYTYMNNFNPQITPKVETKYYPILGPNVFIMNEWMEQDMRESRKQRHTTKRIFIRLWEEHGFQGSYASVKQYEVKSGGILIKHGKDTYQSPNFWDMHRWISEHSCIMTI